MADPFAHPPAPSETVREGWFPDPLGRYEHRWFNGTSWTADVADGGRRQVDPLGAGSTPPPINTQQPGNGIAVAALTCGILSVLLAWMPFVVVAGFVLAVLAVVFGVRGQRRSREVGRGGGPAIAGLVTGIIGLALSVVGVVFTVVVYRAALEFIEPGRVEAEVVSCELTDDAVVIDARLTNRSDDVRDYTVFGVVRSPLRPRVADAVSDVLDVDPGQTVEFQLRHSWSGDAGSCDADVVVHGPRPFGLEVDRVNGVLVGGPEAARP